MKRYRTAVRSLARILAPRPTPAPDLIPKLDQTLQMLDEVRALIIARQAALRATVAGVALVLMLGATPVWSEGPCHLLSVNGHETQAWCTRTSQEGTLDQIRTSSLWIGGVIGAFVGILPGLALGALSSWQARTKAAMAEEMLANVRVHLRESPRS